MVEYIKPITKKCTKKISNQMENSFYIIKTEKGKLGIGCFSYIQIKKRKIPFLITSIDMINKEDTKRIKVLINHSFQYLELREAKYIIKECNIILIQINEDIKYNINYLELDEKLFDNESEMFFMKGEIYIIHCKCKEDISVSYNKVNNINYSKIIYNYNINQGFKYSIIFNLAYNKIIGFHYNNSDNKGILLNNIIKKFKNIIKNYLYQKRNEIEILISIEKEDINRQIYFLSNKYYDINNNKYINCHDKYKILNNSNTELYINEIKSEFNKYFIPKEEGEYKIKLRFNIDLKDCSYMFTGCENIISINLFDFNTKNVTNMKRMFNECNKLKYINLFCLDTKNATDMSYMFNECNSLINLNLTNFDTKNVTNMKYMFNKCSNLLNLELSPFDTKQKLDKINMKKDLTSNNFLIDLNYSIDNPNKNKIKYKNLDNIKLSIFNTENVSDMSYMFCECNKLKKLNLTLFNTKNVENMSSMFDSCENIKKLDLSSFNTKNVVDMSYMFNKCYKLIDINLISFDTNNVTDMEGMFNQCKNLTKLDLSKFNTNKVTDMSGMFQFCEKIKKLDLTSFQTKNVLTMNNMFAFCKNIKKLDLSSFDTEIVTDMYGMFNSCENLTDINISSFNTKNVYILDFMFNECKNLNNLDLSSFNIKNVTTINGIFNGCKKTIIDCNSSKFKDFNHDDISQ